MIDVDDADSKVAGMHPDNPEIFFAERYIDGREFNISVIEVKGEPVLLPLAEIVFEGYDGKRKIVCEKAKWDENSEEASGTVRTFGTVSKGSRLEEKIEKITLKCWDKFNLSGYARVDIRVDALGEPYVLEVNANPTLAKDAGFFAACTEAGYSHNQMIELIILAAMRRK